MGETRTTDSTPVSPRHWKRRIKVGRKKTRTNKATAEKKAPPISDTKSTGNGIVKVAYTEEALRKVKALVQCFKTEVAWYGLTREEPGRILIEDILVPEQEVSSASVDGEEGATKVIQELMASGRSEDVERLRYFGHSHADMGVFASSTDREAFIELIHPEMGGWNYRVYSIWNRKGEHRHYIYLRVPGAGAVVVNDATMVVEDTNPEIQSWLQSVKERVSERRRIYSGVFPNDDDYWGGVAYSKGGRSSSSSYSKKYVYDHKTKTLIPKNGE